MKSDEVPAKEKDTSYHPRDAYFPDNREYSTPQITKRKDLNFVLDENTFKFLIDSDFK